MKKIISIILILTIGFSSFADLHPLDVAVPQIYPLPLEPTTYTDINAYQRGIELIKNSIFTDIGTSPYEGDILRMSAQGVIQKFGSSTYSPDAVLTKRTLFEYLVRLLGDEQLVLTNAINASKGENSTIFNERLKEAYITQAIARGIATGDETDKLDEPVTNEEAAYFSGKAAKIPQTYSMETISTLEDFNDVTPFYRAYIETMLEQNLVEIEQGNYFRPQENMTRAKIAFILSRVSDYMSTQIGISYKDGLVVGAYSEKASTPTGTVTTRYIQVRNVDGTATRIVSKDSSTLGYGFSAYKNNVFTDDNRILPGDEIHYIIKNNQVIFAKVLANGEIRQTIADNEKLNGNTELRYGIIDEISSTTQYKDGKPFKEERFRIKDLSASSLDMILETNLTTGYKQDVIVYKDGKVGGASLLSENDYFEYILKDSKYVIYIDVKPITSYVAKGTLRGLDKDKKTITILDYDNNFVTYSYLPNTQFEINERPVLTTDLSTGMEVSIDVTNAVASKVVADSFKGEPGYISPFSKMRMGTIYRKYSDSVSLKLADGTVENYKIDSSVEMLKGGVKTSMYALKDGDKVKLYFSTIHSTTPQRMEIEGVERQIKNVYKGELLVSGSRVTISNPYYLSPSNWTKDSSNMLTFDLPSTTKIYDGDKLISTTDLGRYYKGSTVYMAVVSQYGKDEIIKMNVKLGGERKYSDQIYDIDRTAKNLEIDSRVNFSYSEGTIFVKDYMLVEDVSLQDNDSVFIIADYYSGSNDANVIRIIDDSFDIFDSLYVGALETVNQYNFTLTNFTNIDNNEWNDVDLGLSDYFQYDDNTKILVDQEEISASELFNGSYSRSENYENDGKGPLYERYYGILYENEYNRVIGLNFNKNGLLPDENIDDAVVDSAGIPTVLADTLDGLIISRGYVSSLDTYWNRISLIDANDWVSTLGLWNNTSAMSAIEYTNALVIKNDKAIKATDINPGDYIYTVRDSEDSLVIIVQ
jgi:hypothetical protein